MLQKKTIVFRFDASKAAGQQPIDGITSSKLIDDAHQYGIKINRFGVNER